MINTNRVITKTNVDKPKNFTILHTGINKACRKKSILGIAKSGALVN